MIANWLYNRIIEIQKYGGEKMLLDVVLAKMGNGNDFSLAEGHPKAVSTLTEAPFYIKPSVTQIIQQRDSKIILFSAPGATGKSSLAKYIAFSKKALLWDLADDRIANHSLSGMLVESLGTKNFSRFTEGLSTGDAFLVIDALDEADMISGRVALETLLFDLRNMVKEAQLPCVVLCARTETAHVVADYFSKDDTKLPISQFEIGFFEDTNAKEFVKAKISEKQIVTKAVLNCIDAQFMQIQRLLYNDLDMIHSFLGYAPVLEALAISYDDEENMLRYLQKINSVENSTEIFSHIMNHILTREHDKVVNGFRMRCEKEYPDFHDWDAVYSFQEQIVRISDYIVFGEIDHSVYPVDLPRELASEYHEIIDSFLSNHPFLCSASETENTYKDYTGPAFRDYCLARLMTIDNQEELAKEYFRTHKQSVRFPSQLFFDFYEYYSSGMIQPQHFPYLYDAFKSKEVADSISAVTIEEADMGVYCVFNLRLHLRRGNSVQHEFSMPVLKQQLYIKQINNAYIDINNDVIVGDRSEDAIISNSTIKCGALILRSPVVFIAVDTPVETLISCADGIDASQCPSAKFEIRADKERLKVSTPDIDSWFKLRKYYYALEDDSSVDETRFENAVKTILKYFRKHGKDAPGKHREFIQNIVIGGSPLKQSVFDFLFEKGIIYEDDKDLRQLKLNVHQLDHFGLNWANISQNTAQKMHDLFVEYSESSSRLQ